MSVLHRKIRRDLRRQRWQYLSIAITVFLGVALFAASYDAFLNLESSYQRTYDRLSFADVTIDGGDEEELAARVAGIPGVAAATTRRQVEIGMRVGGDHTLLGRLVELPESGQPAVNQLDVVSGTWPATEVTAAAVLVERHMADHFELAPGSELEIAASDGSWRAVDVAGTAISAEFLWPARSRQDLLTSPDDFGVVYAPTSAFDAIVANATTKTLVRFEPAADAATVTELVTTEARALGASTIETQAEQPSNAALQEDVAGFGELSLLFPMLFLGAAAMATFILLGRVVRSQQPQVAALRANGVSRAQIITHYLGLGLGVTAAAGALGVVVGIAAGRLVTGLYTGAIDVPDTVTRFHPVTVVVGLSLSVLTGAVAAAAPALAGGRTPPAAALRGIAPAGAGGRSLIERIAPPLRRLPARWRMVLRGIGRDRRRSLSTATGVVLALTLILASWGMVDTVEILLDRQFNEVQHQDAQLYYDPSAGDVIAAIAGVDGVDRVEHVVQEGVVVAANGRSYATELLGFEDDTAMHRFGDVGSPGRGLVAGRSLRSLLDVGVGDTVQLVSTGETAPVDLPIVGFVDEPLGTLVYASASTAEALHDPSAPGAAMVTFDEGADRAVMRQRLTELAGVVAYVDSRALYDTARSLLSLFYVFVAVMLAFGGLMAFALIFNTATVNTSERSPELAAMKVNGASPGQLSRLLAGENLLLTALSLAPGLALGYWMSALFMDSFSSDLFDFGLQMRTRTLALSAGAVLAVSALAQWPASRAIASLDVARVVRERSQ